MKLETRSLETRGEKYEFTERQKELESQYHQVVDILNKSGYQAKYLRYWTYDPTENPGCIQLELENKDEHRGVQEHSTKSSP